MNEIERKIMELRQHKIRDNTGWVGQRDFIKFLDDLIELLLTLQEKPLKDDIMEILENYLRVDCTDPHYPLPFRRISSKVNELRINRALKQLEKEGKIEETNKGWRLRK